MVGVYIMYARQNFARYRSVRCDAQSAMQGRCNIFAASPQNRLTKAM